MGGDGFLLKAFISLFFPEWSFRMVLTTCSKQAASRDIANGSSFPRKKRNSNASIVVLSCCPVTEPNPLDSSTSLYSSSPSVLLSSFLNNRAYDGYLRWSTTVICQCVRQTDRQRVKIIKQKEIGSIIKLQVWCDISFIPENTR